MLNQTKNPTVVVAYREARLPTPLYSYSSHQRTYKHHRAQRLRRPSDGGDGRPSQLITGQRSGMPGPGAHLLYALSGGAALSRLAGPDRRFGPHHCAVYAANAFLGPDLGSFAEWLCSFLPSASAAGDLAMAAVHHPFYYPVLLGLPLAWAYAWLSRRLLRAGVLDSPSGVPLRKRQCFLLISAGSLSHFFLDHLFEENGHSTMYTWILSTGWWKGRAPINPDAVLVVGLLCTCLMGGFVYINRVKQGRSAAEKSNQSFFLILMIATLYCMWCASQIYLRQPPQPAIGEEADLGVIIFLAIYLFLPHGLCVLSMNQKDYTDALDELSLQ